MTSFAIVAGATSAHADAAEGRSAFARTMALRGVRDLGPADPHQRMELTVTFRRQHDAELAELVQQQSDRTSRSYGRYLTPQQFDAYFGPSAATVAAVTKAFAARGFVAEAGALPASVERFAGPVSTVDAMFSTEVHAVSQAGRGSRVVNVTPVSIPAEIATNVASVSGFDNIDDRVTPGISSVARQGHTPAQTGMARVGRPQFSLSSRACRPATKPNTTDLDRPQISANGNPGYGPSTFESDFNFPIEEGCGGRGVKIGVIGAAEPAAADIAMFYKYFNVARSLPPYTLRPTQTGTGVPTYDPTETTLDIDTVSALAPDSPVILYQMADSSFASVIGAMNAAAADNSIAVLNISFADCEESDQMDTLATDSAAEQLVAQGITVVASSGDTGYGTCFFVPGASAPASSQYVVAVGGVGPAVATGGNSAYRSVIGWSGSGGGASAYVPRPKYQKYIAACSGVYRCFPDIAIASGLGIYPQASTAIDGAFIFAGGTSAAISGTSLSAPIFTAMQAEAVQLSGRRHGFINPLLYADAAVFGTQKGGYNPLRVFEDVTQGNNGEPALRGWDYVTGLGVPDGVALANLESFL